MIDQCSKDPRKRDALLQQKSQYRYLCSVAHVEELLGALEGAKDNPWNMEQAAALKACMEALLEPGVLNPPPGGEGEILLTPESIDQCLARTAQYYTRDTIRKKAALMKETPLPPPAFSRAYHDSNEPWHAIWEEVSVKEAIKARNAGPDPRQLIVLFLDACSIYGPKNARLLLAQHIQSARQTIVPGMFPDVKSCFNNVEYVMEQLSRVLRACGYHRDKTLRTVHSGEYDISHLIYATFCDCFVTQDDHLAYRARAIYDFLGAPVKTVLLDKDFQPKPFQRQPPAASAAKPSMTQANEKP